MTGAGARRAGCGRRCQVVGAALARGPQGAAPAPAEGGKSGATGRPRQGVAASTWQLGWRRRDERGGILDGEGLLALKRRCGRLVRGTAKTEARQGDARGKPLRSCDGDPCSFGKNASRLPRDAEGESEATVLTLLLDRDF
nr:unnamed protein product [Digitaria exilis]